MSPRETIARAIASDRFGKVPCKIDRDWPEFASAADAVIDALEKMEVTEGMREAFWDGTGGTPADLWRAMVGAMKE